MYGVALHSFGKVDAAIDTLAAANRAHPRDRDILKALASFHRDAGHTAEAERYFARLREFATQ